MMEIILLRHPVVWLFEMLGIVVGGVAILAILMFAVYSIWKKRGRRRDESERPSTNTNYE